MQRRKWTQSKSPLVSFIFFNILEKYGLQLSNLDLVSLQEGRKPSSKIVNFAYNYLLDTVNSGIAAGPEHLNVHSNSMFGQTHQSNMSGYSHSPTYRNKLLMLSLQYFHSISISHNEIDLTAWKTETSNWRGFKKTIFDTFDRVLVPVAVGDEHYFILEIKNRKQDQYNSLMNSHYSVQKYLLPEICLYDSNMSNFKH
jgi:hypothetical protein